MAGPSPVLKDALGFLIILEEYDEAILYGISFFKKRCMVKLHLV